MDIQSKIGELKQVGFQLESTETSGFCRWMNNVLELESIRRYDEALSCCRYLLDSYPEKRFEIYKRMVAIEEEHAQWARENNDWMQNDNSIWYAYRCLRLAGYNRYEFSEISKRLMASLSKMSKR